MERIREDLGQPRQSGLRITYEAKLDGAEQQSAHADHQPHGSDIVQEGGRTGCGRQQPAQRRIGQHDQRSERPDGHQDDLAAQVVTDLDLFLVLVRGLVGLVIALGLEEEVARLARRHRNEPGHQRGRCRVGKQQGISPQETQRTEEMQ